MRGPVTAVILAAGFSSRMGAFKALLPFGETTVLEQAINLFRAAGVNDIRVVVGHRAAELLPLLEELEVRPLLNERYQQGMYSSVATAAESLEDGCGAFFLLPVDIPLVRRETIELLVSSYHELALGILYPVFRGTRGHPPLIANSYRERILAWGGNGGLKALLELSDGDSADIECADEGVLLDMDTPQDYERLRYLFETESIPDRNVCEQKLKERFPADSPIVEHCRTVARVALFLAEKLNTAGYHFNLRLVEAASLLHDVAKGVPDHAAVGASILRAMGYGAVADLVAVHMELPIRTDGAVDAADLLYLADKLVEGARCVLLETRFRHQLECHAHDYPVFTRITRRLEVARSIQRRIETCLGFPLAEMLLEVQS